jgi:RNA polymerase sigma factor (sigma-70 family)
LRGRSPSCAWGVRRQKGSFSASRVPLTAGFVSGHARSDELDGLITWELGTVFGQESGVGRETTDAEAIAASLSEPTRFGEVFERHFEAVYGYFVRRVGARLAEELAAEAFTQAFRVRGSFDMERDDARPWLFGIAANLLRRHYRDERRRLMAYAKTGLDPVVLDETDEVDSRTDADAISRQLALALASLRSSEREVLLLYAWAELSYQEIAEALGTPVGTVRSRLSRARRRLRGLLFRRLEMSRLSELQAEQEATADG